MRLIIRSALISYASIQLAQMVVGGLDFGSSSERNMVLVMLAILLLNIFMLPLFRILSLPHFGIGFLFLNFILTLVILYVLTYFLSSFSIVATEISQLRIFGFVLPSKHLTVFWSAAYSALIISLVYHFIEWLFDKR